MSQDPKKRNKDSKDVAEENIVEKHSKDNEDPAGAEPTEVSGEREQALTGAAADSLVL